MKEVGIVFEPMLLRLRVALSTERGTTFIEYVVVAAVAMVLILGAIQSFFGGVASMWNQLTSMVTGAG